MNTAHHNGSSFEDTGDWPFDDEVEREHDGGPRVITWVILYACALVVMALSPVVA
jgi:hypothetical protein